MITLIASLIPQSTNCTWCLHEAYLTNKSYCFDIQLAIKEHLLHNATPDISPVLLWEAHKQVIRGTWICVSSQLNKEKTKLKLKHLENTYYYQHLQFQSHPTPTYKSLLEMAKLEFDLLLAEAAKKSIGRARHTMYLKANKPDTILALRLRQPDRMRKPCCLKGHLYQRPS